jgi:hypothetical protein
MTTTTKRAAKGGEFGANGEFYEGGKFINTVAENRKREGSAPAAKARKQEIAPFVWEFPADGMNSIYRKFAGIFGKVVNGRLEVLCSDVTLAYTGTTREQAQELADKWNAGQRWM